ncbi:MAG: ribosomal protein S18-alanine N-acetyltransferase [candidate division WOR-3 bacterium]
MEGLITAALIRPMTEEDLDDVEKLEQATFVEPWSQACFRQDLHRPHSLALVAVKDGRLAGYAVAWAEEELHVANIAVEPAFRRLGIGRALMQQLETFGRRRGVKSVYLEVRQSNTEAQAFYRRLGFVQTYVRRGYYSNGEDAVVMEKDIAAGQGQ